MANYNELVRSANSLRVSTGTLDVPVDVVVISSTGMVSTVGHMQSSVQVAVPGTVQTQAGATAVTADMVQCTPANAGDGMVLPAAAVGMEIMLQNASATLAMQVYGHGSDTINGTAGATGVNQADATQTIYYCIVAAKWVTK